MATSNSPKTAGAALVALRQRPEHACQECGNTFKGYKGAKYCSALCRNRAHRKKEKVEPRRCCARTQGRNDVEARRCSRGVAPGKRLCKQHRNMKRRQGHPA